jgi:hypothetical protein
VAEPKVPVGKPLQVGVVQHAFQNPRDFVQALHPLSGFWGQTPGDWIFRGHADATYPLLPSAHRTEAWRAFTTLNAKTFQPGGSDDMGRAQRELGLLSEFFRAADEAGLQVPEFTRASQLLSASPPRTGSRWPHEDLIPILALAQHYGVPTRLLDWSRQSRNAAYFAALEPSKKADDLAVWALDSSLLRDHGTHFAKAACRLATAPRSSNANLHAQAGLFTYCQWYEDPKLEPLDEVVSFAVGVLMRVSKTKGNAPIVLRKMVLSRERARDLMRLLHIDGVSAMTMFPGFAGVARHVQELAWCGRSVLGTPRDARKDRGRV